MSKEYKYKSYKEKDSMDKDKLSKNHRRELESSYRMSSKKLIKEELEELDDFVEDLSFENEMKMASLCYRAENLASKVGDKFCCTCPNPENNEMVQGHVDYLRGYISNIEINLEKKDV